MLLPALIMLVTQSAFADFADNIAKVIFQKKVDQVYEKALQCDPLEKDPKSSLDVNDWIKMQPPLPSWQMLAEIEETAKNARSYAGPKSSNDKIRHCLAGCYIAQKLDYPSAVLVGWFKELQDASDCSKKTSFEKRDYEATILGAKGGKSGKSCDLYCKK